VDHLKKTHNQLKDTKELPFSRGRDTNVAVKLERGSPRGMRGYSPLKSLDWRSKGEKLSSAWNAWKDLVKEKKDMHLGGGGGGGDKKGNLYYVKKEGIPCELG